MIWNFFSKNVHSYRLNDRNKLVWPRKYAHLFQFFGAVFASKGYLFKNIFDFTTAGDWDYVAAVERHPALHYGVDDIFLSFGIMGFIVELWNF